MPTTPPETPPTTPPGPSLDGTARRASAGVLATLGAATRREDGDPPDWVRRAHEPAGRHRAVRHRPRLVTVPEQLAEGRRRVSRSAVLGVLVVVLLVALVGGVRVAWAVRDSQPQTIAAPDDADPTAETALQPGQLTRDVEQPNGEPAQVVVHVAGAVARPGIVRLRPGDRVIDAIEAAGGTTDDAQLAAVNLARPVVDGEQVYVPLPGESPPAGASGPGGQTGGVGPDGIVDLNRADATALDTLPGVGPVLAERIVDWREEHGRFTSVDELAEVSGIGEKLLARLRDRVQVGP